MTNDGSEIFDEKEWRRVCDLIIAESNPQRMSELLELLLRELEARRKSNLSNHQSKSSDNGAVTNKGI
jgi:hypothetical protein